MNTFKIILTALLGLYSLTSYSQEPITGIWEINFGENQSSVYNKLNKQFSSDNIQRQGDSFIVENPRLGTEIFDNVFFTFKNNQLQSILFAKIISYEDGFFKPLSINDAKNWLETERPKVEKIINYLGSSITSKYGYMSDTNSNALATWVDKSGNFIELVIDETPDMANSPEFFAQYGAMPAYRIGVHYADKSMATDF